MMLELTGCHPVSEYPMDADSEFLQPVARIDLAALTKNTQLILGKVQPRGLLAVVKWDAYGHGLIPCAEVLDSAGASGFGVSSPQEGIALRKAGIEKPILVMTDWVGKPPKWFLDWNLEAAATSWYKVEYLESASRILGRSIPVHVKFDTGLGRVGIHHTEASRSLHRMKHMRHLNVVGIYSHLDFSGPKDRDKSARQIEIFNAITREAHDLGFDPRWIHLANSAAAMVIPDVPGNLVRTGIALYGQPPSRDVHEMLPLEPVMTLAGRIRSVRWVKRGHGFPAPHFWIASKNGWGAEIAFGCGTNYARSLAGRAPVLFRGRRYPLIGMMSRNSSYIFTGSEKPETGEEAVFWGRQHDEAIFLYELAPLIGALPYELTTWLSPRLSREHIIINVHKMNTDHQVM